MKKRNLTINEIHLAQTVFGSSIDYSQVKVCAVWWILKGYAMSPNGNIYFNHADYVDDFSCTTINKQSWWIHEMAHVWQYQQGVKLIIRALFDRRYKYLLRDSKNFLDYGVEQQAMIVQHFFLQSKNAKNYSISSDFLPFKVNDFKRV